MFLTFFQHKFRSHFYLFSCTTIIYSNMICKKSFRFYCYIRGSKVSTDTKGIRVMVFNTTVNNISAMLWWSLDTTLCDKVCQWLAAGQLCFPSTLISSTNKTDHHDIAEILLKVLLNTITITIRLKYQTQLLPDSLHLLSYITGLELHLGRHGNKPVLTVATKNILLIKYKKFYSLVHIYQI